jgi:hypothetical protein
MVFEQNPATKEGHRGPTGSRGNPEPESPLAYASGRCAGEFRPAGLGELLSSRQSGASVRQCEGKRVFLLPIHLPFLRLIMRVRSRQDESGLGRGRHRREPESNTCLT